MTITIPPAALEAAARALAKEDEEYYGAELFSAEKSWRDFKTQASITALALLENWPGMKWHHDYKGNKRDIILPLPTENEQ